MILPKYQWLIEETTQNCNKFCDKLYISNDFTMKFQVQMTPEVLVDDNFDGFESNFPLDGDTYVFDISHTPTTKEYVNSFTFIANGAKVTAIFVYDPDLVDLSEVTEYGNFYLIKLNTGLHKNRYRNAVNDYLGSFGISASFSGDDMTVTGFPTGTMVDIAVSGDYPTISGITSTAEWGLNNFLPVDNKLCFFNISANEVTGATSTPSIFKEVVLDQGKRVICTIQFTNSFGYDVDMDFYVRDDSFNELEVQTQTAQQGTNTLQFCFTVADNLPYHNLEFLLSDPAAYTSSIVNEMVGFCINEVKIEQIGNVDNVSYELCDTDTIYIMEDDEYLVTYSCGYNATIEVLIDITAPFRLYIEGEGTTIGTMWYSPVDANDCNYGKLYKLEWTDTCLFDDIDYRDEDLRFTNQLLVTGILIKNGLEKVESIGNVTSSGKKKAVYKHTIEVYEFRAHPYSEAVMQTLERAFEHSTVTIDGKEYYAGDNSVFTVSEIDQLIYTGRVDLYLDGSEVIKSTCCC